MVGLTVATFRGVCVVVGIFMSLSLGACSGWLEDQFAVDVAVSENTGGRRITLPGEMPTFDLQRDCIPAHLTRKKDDDKVLECKTPTIRMFDEQGINSLQQSVLRNRFQDYLLWRSEQQCERHKAAIVSTQSAANFGLNTVTTGVAAVAAIVTAPATNILAAIAAFSSGTRSHFNEDVYSKFVGPAVIKRINIDRANKYAEIMGKRGLQVTERAVGTVGPIQTIETTTTTKVEPPTVAGGSSTATVAVAAKATETTTPARGATAPALEKVTSPIATGLPTNVINYAAPRRVVMLQDYTMEEALVDIERYHQLCSFSSGLASLVNPGEKFEDTAKGITQRIDALRDMQTANETQARALITSNGEEPNKETAKRLRETNSDIARQIMILQHRLLTAPMTVDSRPNGG